MPQHIVSIEYKIDIDFSSKFLGCAIPNSLKPWSSRSVSISSYRPEWDMWQSACLVINPITVHSYGFLFN